MSQNKIIGIILLAIGAIALYFGINAANAPMEEVTEALTGQYSDRTMMYLIGGAVAGVAGLLGLDAIGIEAEEFLCEQARQLLDQEGISAEIWQGNFLPEGARGLAEPEDPLVSLTHYIQSAYEQQDFSLSDFAIVFVYPWPGEEHFLKLVFDRFARHDALLLLYRGPFQIELYRKN